MTGRSVVSDCLWPHGPQKPSRVLHLWDSPGKNMAPNSSTLAWKIPWMEEPGRLQSMGSLRSDTTEQLHFSLSCIGEGNGNPLQCSCLENPRDGGAWWAAVYGVAQSRTRLKQLSSSSSSSRQEYWSVLPFPSPRDVCQPGKKPRSPTL